MICRNHVDVAEGVRLCAGCGEPYCPDCLIAIQEQLFCANCKKEHLLNVRSGVDDFPHLNYGRFWRRCAAQIIDSVIVGVATLTLTWLLSRAVIPQVSAARNLLVVLAVWLPFVFLPPVYEALMLSMNKGQTVGKKALRLRVVRPDGSAITAGQAWSRAAIRHMLLAVITFLAIVDYAPFFFTREKTTLHDMLAGTRVVEESQ